MKRTKKLIIFAITIMMALQTFILPAYAAGSGTKADPYVGGNNYADADNGSIILHKLDIAKFETEKAKQLVGLGQLSADGTVTYTGNKASGVSLDPSDVVGTYTTSEDTKKIDVTLTELVSLGNITFHLEQVQLSAGKTPGSTTPGDYEAVTSGIDDYAKTDGSGEISWIGLPNGYYRITEEPNETAQPVEASSYIISLPMVDPADASKTINTVHLYPKNRAADKPIVEKTPPVLSDYNGNILTWTVKSEIPSSLKAEQGVQSYVITDTMSQGITYSGNLSLFYKSGGKNVDLIDDEDYSTTAEAGSTSLSVTLKSDGFTKLGNALSTGHIDSDTNGRKILYMEYDTVINISQEDFEASTTPENDVKLEFTNSDGTDYEDDSETIIVDKFSGLKLIKKDGSDETILLPGAKFKIYTKLSGNAVDTSSVLKDSAGTEIEFTTGANGEFFYGGLGAGSYYIVETAAPAGYKHLTNYTEVTISDADVENNNVKETTVLNYRDNGFSLPTTGGAGTILFIIAGITLITAAIVLYIRSGKNIDAKKK